MNAKKNVARQIYEARVFYDNRNSGNSARCFIFYNEPVIETMLAYSNATTDTCCFTWNSDNAIQVRCYRRGQYITFCGHGLLACAYLWKHLTGAPSVAIDEIILRTADQDYSAIWRRGKLWLRTERIECTRADIPDDIEQWFDKKPTRSALAGTGYRIFEFSRGTDIANLHVNMARLASDDRATIVTQASAPTSVKDAMDTPSWSYELRYFAPQFGVEEDSATGSANAVLADYWAQAGLQPPFHVHQCSNDGGEIFGDIDSDNTHVLISGNVAVLAKGNSYADFRS